MDNSAVAGQNAFMPHLPVLRVVPLEKVRRHEKVDPLRVGRLKDRIATEGIQVNPMVCSEAPSGELVILDGATRTEALRAMDMEFAVVQLVDPTEVTLETWHHVVRMCPPKDLMERIELDPGISLAEDSGPPRIFTVEGDRRTVNSQGVSPNAALSALVDTYIGHWTVSRMTDPDAESVSWRFPDWSVVVEFPTLTVDDVMKAAVGEDLLPAGITRFLVPERALRLNVELTLLTAPGTQSEKQEALDGLLEERARSGRIRRYEETVFILDD